VVINQLVHHAQWSGDDPTGLGCWSWIKLKGKGAQITRIILLYRPCFSDGTLSMYQQHCQGLAWQHCTECPQKAVLTDIEKELQQWQEDGEHIIILMDFNEDVSLPWIKNLFAQLNLFEVLNMLMSPPTTATHNQGSMPIDEILCPVS